jgi:hypothetical protein
VSNSCNVRECRPLLASLDLEDILVNSFSSIDCFVISLRFLIFCHFLCLFFILLSSPGVFKFFKSYLSQGSNFSSLSPFSSFLFYYTNYFPSYCDYPAASHFHLFLDAFLHNRQVVLFNVISSSIFGNTYVYCNLWSSIFLY